MVLISMQLDNAQEGTIRDHIIEASTEELPPRLIYSNRRCLFPITPNLFGVFFKKLLTYAQIRI